MVDEAEIEHMSAKMLIAHLKEMGPEDGKYAATFTVLGEYVKHHVREEENEMFPQLANAKLDWQQLQSEMVQRRETLIGEHMARESGAMPEVAEERGTQAKASQQAWQSRQGAQSAGWQRRRTQAR